MKYFMMALKDPSFWAVITSNIFTIFLAIHYKWELSEILLSFWIQSVIIGLVNVVRMLRLKNFTYTEGRDPDRKTIEGKTETKLFMAGFFVIHYGFFHFVYVKFLTSMGGVNLAQDVQQEALILSSLAFLATHIYSYVRNADLDFKNGKPDIGIIMAYPYARIIPMHIIIIFGWLIKGLSGNAGVIIAFMILKTFADGLMHTSEHKRFSKM